MALTDLSQTTEALQRLLELNINGQIDPGLTPAATVSTLPPERAAGGANVLNLYCYHVHEDPNNKFRPQQSGGRAIATSPMALVLHYIVTAHTIVNTQFDALGEQRLLGYAMKTFHDYPVIDDRTMVGADRVMPLGLQGKDNRFEITMVQMSATEALTFWANEHEITAKPSAYYEIRPVELAPDRPERLPGIVLSLGAFVVNINTPSIGATESDLTYSLPSTLGGGAVTSRTSPAKIGPPPVNVLRLRGTALSKGQRQQLLLTNQHWSILFPDLPRVPVDIALNGPRGWSQTLVDDGVEITVGDELEIARPGGATAVVALYPGTYVASWLVTLLFDQPDGPRFVDERSNDAAFAVNPRITGFVRDGGTGAVTLSFGGAWLMNRGRPPPADPVAEPELDILLAVDAVGYRLVGATDPAVPETFVIGPHEITYRPSPAANASGQHTVRVVVNGADTQPFWIEIP